MNEAILQDEYFGWMCHLVQDEGRAHYCDLLSYLNDVIFQYTIPMDGNRAADGVDLRYRFGYENCYNTAMIASLLDVKPCSMLEMLVALAFRCEEHIMSDPDIGDRTHVWFWEMIDSLGLTEMTDGDFDCRYTDKVLSRFFNHTYARNGKGSIFTIPNNSKDMRTVELWSQMNWYLNSIL